MAIPTAPSRIPAGSAETFSVRPLPGWVGRANRSSEEPLELPRLPAEPRNFAVEKQQQTLSPLPASFLAA